MQNEATGAEGQKEGESKSSNPGGGVESSLQLMSIKLVAKHRLAFANEWVGMKNEATGAEGQKEGESKSNNADRGGETKVTSLVGGEIEMTNVTGSPQSTVTVDVATTITL